MTTRRRKAVPASKVWREGSDASSALETDFGRLESQQMMAYAKAVSSTSQREKFGSEFSAQVESDYAGLMGRIDEQSRGCGDNSDEAELLALVRSIHAGGVANKDDEKKILVALAEATLRRCRDLIQLYHEIDTGDNSVPEVEQDNEEDEEEARREVERLLGLGKNVALTSVRRAIGIEDEETEGEGVIDQVGWKKIGAVFSDRPLEAHVRDVLSSAEKGVKRMLKSVSGDNSAEVTMV